MFHYIPLHDSPAGKKFGKFNGEDKYTTLESEKLVRLPMYYKITKADQDIVIKEIKKFYEQSVTEKENKNEENSNNRGK